MRNIIKIIAINVFLLFSFLGVLTTGPLLLQVVYDGYQRLNPFLVDGDALAANAKIDLTPNLDLYKEVDWAHTYFAERYAVPIDYKDFVTWRKAQFASETINISKEGIRKTLPSNESNTHEVWLFGGSTMWGHGVDDANTIASHLAKLTSAKIINFGEDGYIARQNLNMLIKAFNQRANDKKITVIFYDGANDGGGHCVKGQQYIRTDREHQIQQAMRNLRNEQQIDFDSTFGNLSIFLDKLLYKLGVRESHLKEVFWDCDKTPRKAHFIASALVNDWKYAAAITEANGGNFIAILQPVLYLSDTKKEHLEVIGKGMWDQSRPYNIMKKQFLAVYSEILSLAPNSKITFLDFSKIFDIQEEIYIDHLHVSHRGNQMIAEAIYDTLTLKNLLPTVRF